MCRGHDAQGVRLFIIGTLALLALAGDTGAAPVTLASGTQSGSDRAYPIPPADGVAIDRDAQVILVRASGHIYAFALSCPHQNAAVKWVAQGNRFQCTKHDSRYQRLLMPFRPLAPRASRKGRHAAFSAFSASLLSSA